MLSPFLLTGAQEEARSLRERLGRPSGPRRTDRSDRSGTLVSFFRLTQRRLELAAFKTVCFDAQRTGASRLDEDQRAMRQHLSRMVVPRRRHAKKTLQLRGDYQLLIVASSAASTTHTSSFFLLLLLLSLFYFFLHFLCVTCPCLQRAGVRRRCRRLRRRCTHLSSISTCDLSPLDCSCP